MNTYCTVVVGVGSSLTVLGLVLLFFVDVRAYGTVLGCLDWTKERKKQNLSPNRKSVVEKCRHAVDDTSETRAVVLIVRFVIVRKKNQNLF